MPFFFTFFKQNFLIKWVSWTIFSQIQFFFIFIFFVIFFSFFFCIMNFILKQITLKTGVFGFFFFFFFFFFLHFSVTTIIIPKDNVQWAMYSAIAKVKLNRWVFGTFVTLDHQCIILKDNVQWGLFSAITYLKWRGWGLSTLQNHIQSLTSTYHHPTEL